MKKRQTSVNLVSNVWIFSGFFFLVSPAQAMALFKKGTALAWTNTLAIDSRQMVAVSNNLERNSFNSWKI